MSITYQTIRPDLYLVQQTIDTGDIPPPPKGVNHIAVIDCSSSMAGDLGRIREQLKKRLPHLLNAGDTFSLIWFSGRGECGVLCEGESVETLRDLVKLNYAIDRWLRPIGLTGFKEPLQVVEALTTQLWLLNKNPCAIFFMSDGCDNQWRHNEILRVAAKLAPCIISATFVEYGLYADRAMLTAMAQAAGGRHMFANDFDGYAPIFEHSLQQWPAPARREIEILSPPIGGFVFALQGDLRTFGVSVSGDSLIATIDASVDEVYSLSTIKQPNWVERYRCADFNRAAYAAISLFAARMQPEILYPLLQFTGDIRFINYASGLFGKQRYTDFMHEAKRAAFDAELRLIDGYDPSRVPPDDAFTLFDLLHLLQEDESTWLLLDHPAFSYSKISRARVNADENLTVAEREQVECLQAEVSKLELGNPRLAELNKQIAEIMARKREALKFEADPAPDGYPISSLTYNQDRANISVLVRKTGKVALRQRFYNASGGEWKIGVPRDQLDAFPTFIWRNYTIVADGLVNVETLPVRLSQPLFKRLMEATNVRGVQLVKAARLVETAGYDERTGHFAVLDLTVLPILNRNMVIGAKRPSLCGMIEKQYALTRLQAHLKVFKSVIADKYPDAKFAGWIEKYGPEAATWLKDQGLTEHSGFSPKMTVAESTDYIVGKELAIKLKGYSTLGKVDDVLAKVIAKKKLNGPERLMSQALIEIDGFCSSKPKKLHQDWLIGKQKALTAEVRGLQREIAQAKFAIIVGQTWFSDCATLDDNALVDVEMSDGVKATGVAELREIQIKV